VLLNLAADDPEALARVTAFAQGLGELGWTVGRNVMIDYRWGGGDTERIRTSAAELVALAPDVILANSSSVVGSLLQATRGSVRPNKAGRESASTGCDLGDEHADAPHPLTLLRAPRKRPRGRRAAEQSDELAASHSITSSARASRFFSFFARQSFFGNRLLSDTGRTQEKLRFCRRQISLILWRARRDSNS
jgi:hypothetical protein